MFLQAQRAFSVPPERHYRLLHAAAEEKPRIIVLNVLVQAADNLEAKDANGKPFIRIVCLLKRISSDGPPSYSSTSVLSFFLQQFIHLFLCYITKKYCIVNFPSSYERVELNQPTHTHTYFQNDIYIKTAST